MRNRSPRVRGLRVECDCRRPLRPVGHGTEHNYDYHRCGCEECLKGHREHQAEMKRRHETGESAYVPADASRARLDLLSGLGLTPVQIAERADISPASIRQISLGRQSSVRRTTEAAILSVPTRKDS